MRKPIKVTLPAVLLSLLFTSMVLAQTATTASISGIVIDAQGAVIAGGTATLKNKATNQERTTTTDDGGRYDFTNLEPGVYDLIISATNFKKVTIADIKIDVTKPVAHDVKLEAGGVTEQVTITAGSEILLQKQDATVGNTIDTKRVAMLPNITREATRLLALQPGTTLTGEITGARSDQSTLTLDGIDVSDSVIGATFRTVVPTPTEAIEEIHVTVANPNASFGRSSGGQAVFVTKSGGNSFHGSAYEYYRNRALNANTWTNNRLGIPRAFLIDNRFGGTFSGPIFKNKTFFFFLYEGRRSLGANTITRIVPTATLKQGLLRFQDAAGAIQTIDPKTFDPRALGANAAILQTLQLLPNPNDFSQGDGLNTAGFTANIPAKINDNLGILRIDHAFNSKWRADGSLKAFRELADSTAQVDIAKQRPAGFNPSRPGSLSVGLTGTLTPNLINEFRFGYTQDRLVFGRQSPVPQLPVFNIAVDLAGSTLDEPVDVDTQRARQQARTVHTYQFIDNATWSKSTHNFQAGFNVRHITSFDLRDDKVIGSIATPVTQIGSLGNNVIPAAQRPSFIRTADVSRYNNLYATLLGQVDTITYLSTRDATLAPNPIGTPLLAHSKLNAYEIYGADTWRLKPSLTISYGLLYEWQVPPTERDGKQALAVFKDTNQLINPKTYLQQKFSAAAQGQVFNPDIAYIPIKQSGRKYAFNIDRKNFSPRIAAAWNPSFRGGLMGRIFGDRDTVIRGGYSLLYDRTNTVQSIIIPTLGVGFAQTVSLPGLKNAAGQPFRAVVDGPFPLPAPSGATSPVVPAKPFGEVLSFVNDPFITVPRSHTIDFTIQRTLPGKMVLEVGYVGRLGRNLYQSLNLNQVPYNFKDPVSGQTFAQAFDLLANELRAGVAPASVTAQPWFENLLVKLTPTAGSNRTRTLAALQTSNLINGNLSNLFLGTPSGLDFLAAQPFDNIQSNELFFRTSIGRSNYHALVATLRRRFSNGLSFDLNYTFSKILDQIGNVQNAANLLPNSFNLDAEYVKSNFDTPHIFNANWVYELPFGKGKRFGVSSNSVVSRVVSGWYTSGIFRASSGTPISIVQGSQVWGGSQLLGTNSGAILLPGADFSTGLHRGVVGSGGVGTQGATGSRLNIFGDPQSVLNSVRRLALSFDGRSGRNALRGFGLWQADLSIGKATNITERVRFIVSMDMINAFNHVNFADPSTSLTSPSSFGVITSQRIDDGASQGIGQRRIQFGGRIEF